MCKFKQMVCIALIVLIFEVVLGGDVLYGQSHYLYVGTYTAPNVAPGGQVPSTAEGIYVFKMDQTQSALELIQVVTDENPSFLAVDPTRNYLYCVNELGADHEGSPLGRVSAYKINQSDGTLRFINTQLTNGTWPCHIWVHPSGKYLFAANYGSGTFPVFSILADGSIGEMTDLVQAMGNGAGPYKDRQEGPHAHMILTNPGAQHVFGVNLGADQILAWDFDLTSGTLNPGIVPYGNVLSGAGCRHLIFHPTDKFAYVINELSSSIDAFDFDPIRGSFIWIQTVSTLPENISRQSSSTAEIRIHPNGKWIYGTNRGMDTIAMFSVDEQSGKLNSMGWVSTKGQIPRGMNIDPSGTFLYVGNQNSDNIIVFRIDPENGSLKDPVATINSPVPVDFVFGPPVL
ncbi:MAG: lactonase family protein [Candidatus Vecturithrix sp.]|jgi:6-phosphogluconolactonase|nr:lactonase family protein [Candidatus Vecturithrix sp.]